MLSQAVKDFIGVGLHIDGGAPYPDAIRTSMRSDATRRNEVETGLRELLQTRELTTREYFEMTGIDFASEDALYSYLGRMYEYLFRGSEEPPEIPD